MTETSLLWLLGIFIGILLALVAVLYNTLIGSIREIKDLHKEDKKALTEEDNKIKKTVDDNNQSIGREITRIKELIENTADAENKLVWKELATLKELIGSTTSTHQVLCQKHEDRMDSIHDVYKRIDTAIHARLDVLESKIKSQGDFFNARLQELVQIKNKRPYEKH